MEAQRVRRGFHAKTDLMLKSFLVNSDWTEDRELWMQDLMWHYEVTYDAQRERC